MYSVRILSDVTVAGGQQGHVELRSDASNPPTTVRARIAGGITGTVVVGVSLTDTAEDELTYVVPVSHFVELVTVNETGTPTFTLEATTEIPIG